MSTELTSPGGSLSGAIEIANEDLPFFLVDRLSNACIAFEMQLYETYMQMVPSYTGGLWSAFSLPSGAFFLHMPDERDKVSVSWAGNQFEAEMSPLAASLSANLMAMSHLLELMPSAELYRHLQLLKDFAFASPEGCLIVGILD